MNTRLQAFQDFLAAQSFQIPLWGFIFNLTLTAVLSYILGRVYVKYGRSLSNREQFSRNFVLLAMTTTLMITIIKSSLALSLGLVGALSIVRFRAAIKDPEELTYLFLNIAIGLGLGAEQRLVTIVAFGLIVGAVWLKHHKHSVEANQNLFFSIVSRGSKKMDLDQVIATLKGCCSVVNLKRFDETKDALEASFLVEFDDLGQLKKATDEMKEVDQDLQVTFLDNRGLI